MILLYDTPTIDPSYFMALFPIIIIILIWDLIWRGFALWRAARNSEKGWFIALMIFSTVGILPIIYLIIDNRRRKLRGATK